MRCARPVARTTVASAQDTEETSAQGRKLHAKQNHSNRVVFDEAAMAVGIALYAEVASRHLAPSGQ